MTRMNELEAVVKIRDDEINRLGSELQRETGRDGFLVSLKHKYDQQQEESDKLRAQVRVVNPNSTTGRKPRHLILKPARTTVSIEDSVFIETSKTLSMNSSAKDDISSAEEDLPTPRAPIRPEPLPEQQPIQQQPQPLQPQPNKTIKTLNVSDIDDNNDNKKSSPQVQFHEDTLTTVKARHYGSKKFKSRVKVQQQQQ